MKIQIERLKTHSEMFETAYSLRKANCDERHDQASKKLEAIPSIEMMAIRDKKQAALDEAMEKMNKRNNILINRAYIAFWSITGIVSFVKWVLPFAIKTLK